MPEAVQVSTIPFEERSKTVVVRMKCRTAVSFPVCLLVNDDRDDDVPRPFHELNDGCVKCLPDCGILQPLERAASVDYFRPVENQRFIWVMGEYCLL